MKHTLKALAALLLLVSANAFAAKKAATQSKYTGKVADAKMEQAAQSRRGMLGSVHRDALKEKLAAAKLSLAAVELALQDDDESEDDTDENGISNSYANAGHFDPSFDEEDAGLEGVASKRSRNLSQKERRFGELDRTAWDRREVQGKHRAKK